MSDLTLIVTDHDLDNAAHALHLDASDFRRVHWNDRPAPYALTSWVASRSFGPKAPHVVIFAHWHDADAGLDLDLSEVTLEIAIGLDHDDPDDRRASANLSVVATALNASFWAESFTIVDGTAHARSFGRTLTYHPFPGWVSLHLQDLRDTPLTPGIWKALRDNHPWKDTTPNVGQQGSPGAPVGPIPEVMALHTFSEALRNPDETLEDAADLEAQIHAIADAADFNRRQNLRRRLHYSWPSAPNTFIPEDFPVVSEGGGIKGTDPVPDEPTPLMLQLDGTVKPTPSMTAHKPSHSFRGQRLVADWATSGSLLAFLAASGTIGAWCSSDAGSHPTKTHGAALQQRWNFWGLLDTHAFILALAESLALAQKTNSDDTEPLRTLLETTFTAAETAVHRLDNHLGVDAGETVPYLDTPDHPFLDTPLLVPAPTANLNVDPLAGGTTGGHSGMWLQGFQVAVGMIATSRWGRQNPTPFLAQNDITTTEDAQTFSNSLTSIARRCAKALDAFAKRPGGGFFYDLHPASLEASLGPGSGTAGTFVWQASAEASAVLAFPNTSLAPIRTNHLKAFAASSDQLKPLDSNAQLAPILAIAPITGFLQ